LVRRKNVQHLLDGVGGGKNLGGLCLAALGLEEEGGREGGRKEKRSTMRLHDKIGEEEAREGGREG
jgi:hypothetical protein